MKKLFVGNLPYQADESQLQGWLSESGVAADQVSIIRDRISGESRGFGFIEISNDDEATRAIMACNGQDFLGRSLVINEARPMTERAPMRNQRSDREAGGGSGGYNRRGSR